MTKFEFLYGTAWKEDLTEGCVFNALTAGYRAIDTANQKKHYNEEGVGKALLRAYSELGLKRQDLFLQTKFTFASSQDHRKPYDEKAPFRQQVQQSFASSLEHLHTDYLDSYILHGPSSSIGLTSADWETWKAIEELAKSGQVRHIGVSNVGYEQLVELSTRAKIKPRFVQNRCFAETRWDHAIRQFCNANGILYQGFSLLTANWKFLAGHILRPEGRNIPHLVFDESSQGTAVELHSQVAAIVQSTGKNIQQVVFRFCQQLGMIPLTGTRSFEHMKTNLQIQDLHLTNAQMQVLENIANLK